MPERVEEAGLPMALQPVAGSDVGAGGRIVPIAVHDQNSRVFERGHKEDRGMRIMVTDFDDRGQLPDIEVLSQPRRQQIGQYEGTAALERMRLRPNTLRLAGSRPIAAWKKVRLNRRLIQGVVMMSTFSSRRPARSKPSVSESEGKCCVCFCRLKRSSSRTKAGTPSLSNATPESWVEVTMPRIFIRAANLLPSRNQPRQLSGPIRPAPTGDTAG